MIRFAKCFSSMAVLVLTFLIPADMQAALTDGLVAWYKFDGNTNDSSGNGHHLQVADNSPTLATDRFGNANSAYYFSGNAEHLLPSDDFYLEGNFTASLWFFYRDREMVSRLTDTGGTITLFAVWGRTSYAVASRPTTRSADQMVEDAVSAFAVDETVPVYRSGTLPSGDGIYELISERDADFGFVRIAYSDGEVVMSEAEIIEAGGILAVVLESGEEVLLED